jgi:hypothetical protein
LKFSVIIPLEFHRGQGTHCVTAWCRHQTFPMHDFEIICVMPITYPAADRQAIEAVLRPQDRLIPSNAAHDMTHCVEGAAVARGENLFFTESHVWPEPDVLEASAQTLEHNPDWAGFSCRTTRIANSRLAEAEADMYEADTDYGMNVHAWRKILDACFVTRRREYFAAGGFDDRLGHFAEWALAAAYHRHSFKVGYAPQIILRHYYIGQLTETDKFSRDFIDGEIRYFSENDGLTPLLEPPEEWLLRGNWDRNRNKALLRALLPYLARRGRRTSGPGLLVTLKAIAACLPIAMFGVGLAFSGEVLRRLWRRVLLEWALRLGSRETLSRRYISYQVALVRERRLQQIARLGEATLAGANCTFVSLGHPDSATAIAGFHSIEVNEGVKFRWSKPAAIIAVKVPAGPFELRLRCLANQPLMEGSRVRFFINETPVRTSDVVLEGDEIFLFGEGHERCVARLAWICNPLTERNGKRRLGLPVVSVTVDGGN